MITYNFSIISLEYLHMSYCYLLLLLLLLYTIQ